jgi:zinc transporter 5/7
LGKDTLGSVGVILSTLLIEFYGWTGFDPIASLFIAALIAASVTPLVIDTAKILSLDVADRQENIHVALAEAWYSTLFLNQQADRALNS